MFTVIGCLTGQHDLRLVGLAAFICVVACFTSLSILARAQARGGRQGAWLLAAAATFGAAAFLVAVSSQPGRAGTSRIKARPGRSFIGGVSGAGAMRTATSIRSASRSVKPSSSRSST